MSTFVSLRLYAVPFTVPETVTLRTTEGPDVQVSLSEISSEELDALCEEFAEGIFQCAGKCRPPKAI